MSADRTTSEWKSSTGHDEAAHAVAAVLCWQEHGDWRYDPGDQAYAPYFSRADHVMRAALPHLKVTEDMLDAARDAIHDEMAKGQMHSAMPTYSDLARVALTAAFKGGETHG